MTAVPPYRAFRVQVAATEKLSPHFVRVTLSGPELADFRTDAPDQRLKIILPPTPGAPIEFPEGPDWYQQYLQMPEERRPIMRTYTVRSATGSQIDVDFVLHGDAGPASRWVAAAEPGDEIMVFGPNRQYEGPISGYAWVGVDDGTEVLLAGDETAVPAIAGILDELKPGVHGAAYLEVPTKDDVLPVCPPPGVAVHWLPRTGGQPVGRRLVETITQAGFAPTPDDGDDDESVLWDVGEWTHESPFVAWLAGEAATIKTLRRHLVRERNIDKRAVAFMGYWKYGRPES
ncbi:siderophore-interacting protein [Spelaeicoccus albus]|uniref:NADPH-dependent ferric siderophore reductase n=1 Tax=Spelaeicoccus albus TaxID=1280376 RepID=A0A7Z0D477_9MICO|nr:siderophore-interacting protein [Spelaeicoccus albus]NYI68561.1 NADPH-dependent ferric siderophore reductase [Spelaeicoccus albus]